MFHAFTSYPACMVYTTEAVNLPGEGAMYKEFSGQVVAGVEVLLRYRELKDGNAVFADTNDMESLPDAVEDALYECLFDQKDNLTVSGFHWTRRFTSSREPVQLFGDGHAQRLTFALDFTRHV